MVTDCRLEPLPYLSRAKAVGPKDFGTTRNHLNFQPEPEHQEAYIRLGS